MTQHRHLLITVSLQLAPSLALLGHNTCVSYTRESMGTGHPCDAVAFYLCGQLQLAHTTAMRDVTAHSAA